MLCKGGIFIATSTVEPKTGHSQELASSRESSDFQLPGNAGSGGGACRLCGRYAVANNAATPFSLVPPSDSGPGPPPTGPKAVWRLRSASKALRML